MFKPDSKLVTSVVEAKHWIRSVNRATPLLIVIHSAETSERVATAENIANWFRTMPENPKASAHYVVDADTVLQCVPELSVAYHARGGVTNLCAIGIELAGRASQTREQWLDEYGVRMLRLCRTLLCDISYRLGIPLTVVDERELTAHKARGVTTHAAITRAWRVPGGHTDPGPNFPMDVLLSDLV
jgi:N-acetyl-anhydromuramyl-L-alanine amidase AmpD